MEQRRLALETWSKRGGKPFWVGPKLKSGSIPYLTYAFKHWGDNKPVTEPESLMAEKI